jgi:hypothetical protein
LLIVGGAVTRAGSAKRLLKRSQPEVGAALTSLQATTMPKFVIDRAIPNIGATRAARCAHEHARSKPTTDQPRSFNGAATPAQ